MDLIISYHYLGKYHLSSNLLKRVELMYSILIIANNFNLPEINVFLNSAFMEKIKKFF